VGHRSQHEAKSLSGICRMEWPVRQVLRQSSSGRVNTRPESSVASARAARNGGHLADSFAAGGSRCAAVISRTCAHSTVSFPGGHWLVLPKFDVVTSRRDWIQARSLLSSCCSGLTGL